MSLNTHPHRSPLRRAALVLAAVMLSLSNSVAPPAAAQDDPQPTPPPPAGEKTESPRPAADYRTPPPTDPAEPVTPPPTDKPTPAPDETTDKPATDKPARVAIIPIDGPIYGFTLDSLQRRSQRALDEGATHIVIEINTNGGEVGATLDITKHLKRMTVPTTCWINDKAYSAGILIASSCNEIVMSPSAITGDCAPIQLGLELAPTERQKVVSPIVADFRDNSVRNGYPFAVLHATCELGIQVYEIEHKESKQRKFVNQIDYEVMVNGATFEEVDKPGFLNKMGVRKKRKDGIATQLDVYEATEEDRGQWISVRARPAHNGKSLLTVSAKEAKEITLAKASDIRTRDDLAAHLGQTNIVVVNETWSEQLAAFLTNPFVRGLLILVMVAGVYLEMNTPGLGVPGAFALAALIGLIAPPFVIGLAETWEIVLIGIGVILLVLELVLFPGFGVPGVSGILCILTGLVFMAAPAVGDGPLPLPSGQSWNMVGQSFLSVLAGIGVGVLAVAILSKYFDTLPVLNRIILQTTQPVETVAAGATGNEPVEAGIGDSIVIRIGDVGAVTADLHPAGRARFGNAVVDVVSVGNLIRAGREVRIVQIEGNRVVVDDVTEA